MFLDEPEMVPAAHGSEPVMNYAHAWAWRQDVADAFMAARTLLAGSTSLSPGEVAVVNVAVASARRDAACSLAWGATLAEHRGAAAAADLIEGRTEALSDRERALAAWAASVAGDPNATAPADVRGLRAAGLHDREIAEATMLATFRLAFTAYNDALGVTADAHLVAGAPAEVRRAVTYGRGSEAYSNVAS
jgi:alkylhydroperoxidase family enzyme